MFMATNSRSIKCAKHIDIKNHFVKDIIEQGDIIQNIVQSKEMVVEHFTKPLDTHKFTKCRGMLGMSSCNMLEHPPHGGIESPFASWSMHHLLDQPPKIKGCHLIS